jgi:peptide-methionine (S)-S-oxide reductase
MKHFFTTGLARIATALATMAVTATAFAATALPSPTIDTPLASKPTTETAVLAGGCFWGIEAVFEHLKGVTQATSGYSGGSAENAKYDKVSSGSTGHAEAVRISYDPSRISFGQLLKVFFSVAHNPTELNRQGPDVGTQYRSSIFYGNEEQKKVAQAYIAQLNAAKVFPRAIVTEVVPLKAFYEAEAYHQDYAARNPSQPYIVVHDLPKVANLQKQFPELYLAQQTRAASR